MTFLTLDGQRPSVLKLDITYNRNVWVLFESQYLPVLSVVEQAELRQQLQGNGHPPRARGQEQSYDMFMRHAVCLPSLASMCCL